MTTRLALLLAAALALVSGCERPPVAEVQSGFRGTAMDQVVNPRLAAQKVAANQLPEDIPEASADGPKAGQIYQNVQVLGDLSVGQFTRLMASMSQWVAPDKGCAYCHNVQNFAEDTIYQKVVARRMLLMTKHINADWKSHVANTGVTCYTCHRGNHIPTNVWFKAVPDAQEGRLLGAKAGQNQPSAAADGASLPVDPFTPFLLEDQVARVQGTTALPTGNRQSIKQGEWVYSLMTHMSGALGVNCTYCHNTRSFGSWETSTPQRATAWYGIRMARDLNKNHMEPLTANFPVQRLGPGGDVAKINCATCHQGAFKPLLGASMLKAHPELATLPPPSGAALTPTAATTADTTATK